MLSGCLKGHACVSSSLAHFDYSCLDGVAHNLRPVDFFQAPHLLLEAIRQANCQLGHDATMYVHAHTRLLEGFQGDQFSCEALGKRIVQGAQPIQTIVRNLLMSYAPFSPTTYLHKADTRTLGRVSFPRIHTFVKYPACGIIKPVAFRFCRETCHLWGPMDENIFVGEFVQLLEPKTRFEADLVSLPEDRASPCLVGLSLRVP